LQTSFLTPPMAMSAYYLKGVAPPELQLWTIFKGCFPFLGMVILALVLVYIQPKIVTFLPDLLYNTVEEVQPSDPNDTSVANPDFLLGK
jgi:TRAP-type mannitol/chloroaromatic compound transport system permease large subunit